MLALSSWALWNLWITCKHLEHTICSFTALTTSYFPLELLLDAQLVLYSFIHLVFLEHWLHIRHCARFWGHSYKHILCAGGEDRQVWAPQLPCLLLTLNTTIQICKCPTKYGINKGISSSFVLYNNPKKEAWLRSPFTNK